MDFVVLRRALSDEVCNSLWRYCCALNEGDAKSMMCGWSLRVVEECSEEVVSELMSDVDEWVLACIVCMVASPCGGGGGGGGALVRTDAAGPACDVSRP